MMGKVIAVAAVLLSLAGTSQAGPSLTLTYDFQNVGAAAPGQTLGTSATFTEKTSTGYDSSTNYALTATGYHLKQTAPPLVLDAPPQLLNLFAKNTPGDATETGLGIASTPRDYEIGTTQTIFLDFTNIVANVAGFHGVTINISSVQSQEGFYIFAVPDLTNPLADYTNTNTTTSNKSYTFGSQYTKFYVTAKVPTNSSSGNQEGQFGGQHTDGNGNKTITSDVLLASATVSYDGAAPPLVTPEPSTLLGAGTAVLMGLGYAWKRRKRATA